MIYFKNSKFMKEWKDLSWIEKLVLGFIIIIAAHLSPELMLFVDVGGLEMALSFLVVYYKQWLIWGNKRIKEIKGFCSAICEIFINSSLMKPKVFITHSIYGLTVMWFTGAIVFSMGFMVPALFVTGARI